jgi:hypothetical protein
MIAPTLRDLIQALVILGFVEILELPETLRTHKSMKSTIVIAGKESIYENLD